MTATAFQIAGIAWIGSIVFVLIAALVGATKLLPYVKDLLLNIADLKTAAAVHSQQINDNADRLNRQGAEQQSIRNSQAALLLAAPAPPLPDAPATAPQAPVTASAGFQGIAATPEPDDINLSKPLDRNKLLADIESIRQTVAAAPDPTEAPPPAVPRLGGEDEPTPGITAHSQE